MITLKSPNDYNLLSSYSQWDQSLATPLQQTSLEQDTTLHILTSMPCSCGPCLCYLGKKIVKKDEDKSQIVLDDFTQSLPTIYCK